MMNTLNIFMVLKTLTIPAFIVAIAFDTRSMKTVLEHMNALDIKQLFAVQPLDRYWLQVTNLSILTAPADLNIPSIELECESFASPPPRTIKWTKDGKILSTHEYATNELNKVSNDVMAIVRSRLTLNGSDGFASGKYTCTGESSFSFANATFAVNQSVITEHGGKIINSNELLLLPPRIIYWFSYLSEAEGFDIMIPCGVHSYITNKPNVYWVMPSGELVSTNSSSRIKLLSDYSLLIPTLQLGDAGGYNCHVIDQNGNDTIMTNIYVYSEI